MQRIQVLAVKAARRSWAKVNPSFISESWEAEVRRNLTPVIAAAQVRAAASGATYSAMTLAQQNTYSAPVAFTDPAAFGGYSSGGYPLETLLYGSAYHAKGLIADGASAPAALERTSGFLDTVVSGVIADAARQAASVDIATRPGTGYVRMLNPPSCSRCVVLAGRYYRWNAGFRRHPGCDCVHVASRIGSTDAALSEGLVDDPYAYFKSLSKAEQDRIFGKGYSDAIRDGGDIYQVVNSRRGRKGAFTTEGTGRRGHAGSVLKPGQRRMTPDTIYRLNPNRADAIQALKDQGYILPQGQVAGGVFRGANYEGFGALGRGGTRRAASQAVLDARASGIRDPRSRYTMTAAERRLYDARQRYEIALSGRSPYTSPGFGSTPDPYGLGLNRIGASYRPVTPKELAQAELDYRRWLATNGEVFDR